MFFSCFGVELFTKGQNLTAVQTDASADNLLL